jgi:hypothetical protein
MSACKRRPGMPSRGIFVFDGPDVIRRGRRVGPCVLFHACCFIRAVPGMLFPGWPRPRNDVRSGLVPDGAFVAGSKALDSPGDINYRP